MPTYTNTSEAIITPPGYKTLAPGETLRSNKYLYPVPTGIEFASHEPRVSLPWITKYAGSLAAFEVLTGLAQFRSIVITNNTGNVIEIVANADSDNILYVLNGSTWPIDQNKEIETLDISGSGEGSVYVFGTI
jgi:hypothetical protein